MKEKINWKKEIIWWIKVLVIAVAVSFAINNFVIINANVPSGSMENNIMTGDRMIGNRLAYVFGDIERGDIAIFKFPDNEKELFVKRVIGLPGDHVKITNGKVYINNNKEPLVEDYLKEDWTVFNDGLEYDVPEGCYFMLGDNRNISRDSRYWKNTYVAKDKILAEAACVYWPFTDSSILQSADYDVDGE